MLEKVLVANRGEIAVRVMRACEELGVDSVAVYSDADSEAGHVRYADEAYNVGPARAADSYLDHDAIIDAARRSGADAIHPGYGFLAENATFARKVEKTEGITWVGPSADAMESLGEKTNARQLMVEADVPIIPGTTEPVDDSEEVVAFSEEYGFPVAIKAEGGGGGRGMKIVHDPDEVADQLESTQREGKAYFDNANVYLERYLENPRHIEVQIVADQHGNVCHLGERDCSLQRRYQKVIEEGPSPALSDDLREKLGDAARRGIEKANYTNAGTVEFLVKEGNREPGEVLGTDADFFFLEVNTRIQVEHCVTEEITGIDIVKWQLRIASGEEIGFAQDDLEIDGHAMEFRINAENAADDFAPSRGGNLSMYDPPGGIGVRLDDALRQGDDLVTDYDSMIAKLIVSGSDREEVVQRGDRALAEYDIEGIQTIIPFHRLMLTDETFIQGMHTTKYLDETLDPERIDEAQERWGAEADAMDSSEGAPTRRKVTVEVDGKRFDVALKDPDAAAVDVGAGGGGGSQVGSSQADDDSGVSADGQTISAEMQGTILTVNITEGDEVVAGDVILVLEAMKMENNIIVETDGTVAEVAVNEGESVDMGDPLVVLE